MRRVRGAVGRSQQLGIGSVSSAASVDAVLPLSMNVTTASRVQEGHTAEQVACRAIASRVVR